MAKELLLRVSIALIAFNVMGWAVIRRPLYSV